MRTRVVTRARARARGSEKPFRGAERGVWENSPRTSESERSATRPGAGEVREREGEVREARETRDAACARARVRERGARAASGKKRPDDSGRYPPRADPKRKS